MNKITKDTPVLLLFASANDYDNMVVMSGEPYRTGEHMLFIACDDLELMINICDAYLKDIKTQRDLFQAEYDKRQKE